MNEYLQSINNVFSTVNCSKYEQGLPLVLAKIYSKNKFFSESRRAASDNFKRHPVALTQTTSCPQQIKPLTLFHQFVLLIEGYVLDQKEYGEIFKNKMNDIVLKQVSNKHRVLKKDLFDFIDSTDYVIPKNHDIIRLFCNLLKTTLIIVNQTTYTQFNHRENGHNSNVEKVYVIDKYSAKSHENLKIAVEYLVKNKYFEDVLFEKLKLVDLKKYAYVFGIDISSVSKKPDIIYTINKHIQLNKAIC
jgi:hypothetical protein